ncbi:MAG: hypothetical protein ACRCUM_02215 [Mycoplasmoidaceae bacterium]
MSKKIIEIANDFINKFNKEIEELNELIDEVEDDWDNEEYNNLFEKQIKKQISLKKEISNLEKTYDSELVWGLSFDASGNCKKITDSDFDKNIKNDPYLEFRYWDEIHNKFNNFKEYILQANKIIDEYNEENGKLDNEMDYARTHDSKRYDELFSKQENNELVLNKTIYELSKNNNIELVFALGFNDYGYCDLITYKYIKLDNKDYSDFECLKDKHWEKFSNMEKNNQKRKTGQ